LGQSVRQASAPVLKGARGCLQERERESTAWSTATTDFSLIFNVNKTSKSAVQVTASELPSALHTMLSGQTHVMPRKTGRNEEFQ